MKYLIAAVLAAGLLVGAPVEASNTEVGPRSAPGFPTPVVVRVPREAHAVRAVPQEAPAAPRVGMLGTVVGQPTGGSEASEPPKLISHSLGSIVDRGVDLR